MVAEALPKCPEAPLVLGLQPAALIDNVAPVDWSLLDQIPGDRGGSIAVQKDELEHMLKELDAHISVAPLKKMAGGSVTNTVRGLSVGFGVATGIIGAYGDDEQGQLFVSNMGFSGVSISRLRKKKGSTAQCVCLVDDSGNRTMRPCLSSAVKIQADELSKEDFTGSKVGSLAPLISLCH
jgi:sugar/nucleoside kinase (ribokinase family)